MSGSPSLLPIPEQPEYGGMAEAQGFSLEAKPSLSTRWQEAQSETLSGKLVQLHPRELGFWSHRFSADELDELVIPKRTLARRRARKEALSLEETDKALRLARIVTEADRVFGQPSKADRWLRQPTPALRGHKPLDMLRSETGALAVHELLGQIDHGMFI